MNKLLNSENKDTPDHTLELYRNIFENTFDAILLIDNEFRYIDANPSACALLGYSKAELIDKKLGDLTPKRNIEIGKKIWVDFLRKGNQKGEYILLKKDQKEINVEYHAVANIQPEIHLFIINDVTTKKLAENTLKNKENTLQGIFESSPVGINLIQDRKFIWSNDMMSQITGYSLNEIIENNTKFLYLSDEDYEKAGYDYNKKFANGKVAEIDTRWKRKDGKIIDIHKKMSLLDPNDSSKGYITSVMDITKRKQAEEELSATNKQLKDTIEFLPDATFIVDKDKKILAWNRSIEEMTGIPKEEIIGKDHKYAAVPFYGKRRAHLLDLLFEKNAEIESKYNFVKKRGNSLYVEVFTPTLYNNRGAYIWAIASPLLDQKGNVVGAIEAIRDITEQKRAEDLLKESEEKYRELANSLPEIIFETDEKGNLTFVNRNAFSITGYTAEDFEKGLNALQLLIPEERDLGRDNIRKIFAGAKSSGFEYTALRKDGGTFPIIIHSSAIKHNNKPIGLRGIIFDISERKKAERRIMESEKTLRSILTAAPVGIKLVQDRQIIWCNNSMIEMTGYSLEELTNKNLRFLYPNDEEYDKVGHALYDKWSNEEYREIETTWKKNSGELINCHIRISPLDPTDFNKGMIEIITDITESKKALKQLDENLEYFAHLIDHIRNPLTIICGFAQVEVKNEVTKRRFLKQVDAIEEIIKQLDQGWMDTEDTRKFLKKYM